VTELAFQAGDAVPWPTVLLCVLVSYLLCQGIAWVYVLTHRGASYARSLVVSMVVAGLVSAILMLAIGNSLARGVGIVGTLALIRFRTNLQDPLDMLFVFACFACGVAAGTGSFATAIVGAAAFAVVVAALQLGGFGSRRLHDGVLRVQLPVGVDVEAALVAALRAHCRDFAAVALREVAQGREVEHVYQVTLRRPQGPSRLVEAVGAVAGASGVSISMQEATLEL
jgi:hypothetical protein